MSELLYWPALRRLRSPVFRGWPRRGSYTSCDDRPASGGGVAEIRYTDDIPPQVLFSPALTASSAFPLLGTLFGPASPFAALDRISAAIDREAASLMRQAEMLANAPAFATNRPIEAALGNLPLGTESYSMMSTLSGNGVCSRASRSPRRPTAANRGRVAQFRQLRNDPGLYRRG